MSTLSNGTEKFGSEISFLVFHVAAYLSACDSLQLTCYMSKCVLLCFVSVCRLHGNLDLMHGSCMTAIGLVVGLRAHSCSHGSNHACEWQRPR